MPKCCANCFNDSVLATKINTDGETSRCSYCGKNQVRCIDPKDIADKLEIFIAGLVVDPNGQSLSSILDLYGLISSKVKEKKKESLIKEIFGTDAAAEKYSFKLSINTYTQEWDELKTELKYKNRFFPQTQIYSKLFKDRSSNSATGVLFQLLEQLEITIDQTETYYRARISSTPLTSDKMGCPPRDIVTGGRANPAGIPYLYVADELETCINEVRPSNSSHVYVSEMTPNKELKVLDLTSPREYCTASAFGEDQLTTVLEFLGLLELFSKELSNPIKPENSNLDYIPTQFLCEFMKIDAKLDGIAFNSSFGTGKNYVFFNGDSLSPAEPNKYVITSTKHSWQGG